MMKAKLAGIGEKPLSSCGTNSTAGVFPFAAKAASHLLKQSDTGAAIEVMEEAVDRVAPSESLPSADGASPCG